VKDDLENLSITIYYCTSLGKLKGQLTISEEYLEFFTFDCPENKNLDLKQLNFKIDYFDITGFQPLQLYNNTGKYVEIVDKKNYMHDFYL